MEQNTTNIIQKIIEVFGFSEEKREEVANDLSKALAAQLALILGAKGIFLEESNKLAEALEKDDAQIINKTIEAVNNNAEFKEAIKEATEIVLGSWLESMGENMPDAKRQEVALKLQTLFQE